MSSDPDVPLSSEFVLPTYREVGANRNLNDEPCTYLCGNSLGPLSQRSKALIEQEMQVWATRGVVGHFNHPHARNWVDFTDHVNPLCAEVVGAEAKEVACMGTLTANLHLLMNTFYKPTKDRYKVLCEAGAFPSDRYAFTSQAQVHGLAPKDAVLELSPRKDEFTLREEDILNVLEKEGASIALVLFSGVQYYTGQWFPMERITRKAKQMGCMCGWDLAHAIGNVPLSLHEWNVDFAVWCTYKYLNSGPGGIGGLFIHEKWHETELPKYAGWWGHDPVTRFDMPPKFSPIAGAQGFQQSNPDVLSLASLLGSLQIFSEIGMTTIREQSVKLTAGFYDLLVQSKYYVPVEQATSKSSKNDDPGFTVITPKDSGSRGAQLSLLFLPLDIIIMPKILHVLTALGVIGDERHPCVIRLAPNPLYNKIEDCRRAAACLDMAFDELCQ